MSLANLAAYDLQLQHRHDDGSWGSFEPDRTHHDPADHDPERDWANGTIYRCTTCDEEILVSTVDDPEVTRH
jgi:hypothetical protein